MMALDQHPSRLNNLTDKLSIIISTVLDDHTLATGLRHQIIDMQERLERIEERAEK